MYMILCNIFIALLCEFLSDSCKFDDCFKGMGQTVCGHFEQQACILQGSETLQDSLYRKPFIIHCCELLQVFVRQFRSSV